jgi:hypothetical protein
MSSNPIYDQPLAFLATSFQEHSHWWRSGSPVPFILFPALSREFGVLANASLLWATVYTSYIAHQIQIRLWSLRFRKWDTNTFYIP